MNVSILEEAEDDLERAFEHYEDLRDNLGNEMIDEFRRGVDQILEFPRAWQSLDEAYRRYRLHRFPYGIVYRVEPDNNAIVIVAVMHLHQNPEFWRGRETPA